MGGSASGRAGGEHTSPPVRDPARIEAEVMIRMVSAYSSGRSVMVRPGTETCPSGAMPIFLECVVLTALGPSPMLMVCCQPGSAERWGVTAIRMKAVALGIASKAR
jgi:hypothetical protein